MIEWMSENYWIIIFVLIDLSFEMIRTLIYRRNRYKLTEYERDTIFTALELYQALIVKEPESFNCPLDFVSDHLRVIDVLKEKIE